MMDNTDLVFVQEPEIRVGVMEEVRGLTGRFNGSFRLQDGRVFTGPFDVQAGMEEMIFTDRAGARIGRQEELCFKPEGEGHILSGRCDHRVPVSLGTKTAANLSG
jgi:hypothetical protein